MDINDLRETAELAHLSFGEAELEAAFPAFEQTLDYFEAMQAADNDTAAFGVPLAQVKADRWSVGQEHFRRDTAAGSAACGETPETSAPPDAGASADALLERSGERDDRYIVIPNVL